MSRTANTVVCGAKTFTRYTAISSPFRRGIHVLRDVPSLRTHRRDLLLKGRTIGLVPTMGALHAGHLSLVRQAAAENDEVFVSIYVNPTQFGLNEDLDSYPKTWDSDVAMLKELDAELKASVPQRGRINAIFAPTTKTMYPTLPPDSSLPGTGSFVTITPLANLLEGKSRPVFFRGVATVCMKLFNLVQPERVYFGQKDVQQTVLIKRMVQDFHLNTEVRIGATRREDDGLAMSSRNMYLGERRRKAGVVLYRALRAVQQAYEAGEGQREQLLSMAWAETKSSHSKQDGDDLIDNVKFEVDYFSIADPESLEEVKEVDAAKGAILSGAVIMMPLDAPRDGEALGLGGDRGTVRLIDNIILAPWKP